MMKTKPILQCQAACLFGLTLALQSFAQEPAKKFNPTYPLPFSPTIPKDADLTGVTDVGTARRAFDINSWQTFIALNWPVNASGTPLKKLGEPGAPLWVTWKESTQVFLDDGSKPTPWGSKRILPDGLTEALNPTRVLSLSTKVKNKTVNIADEQLQAFSTYPLIDQNTNIVHYEILMNQEEFNFIVSNELYNLEGQIAYAHTHNAATFPSGALNGSIGAIEIKLAWKTLDPKKDLPSRYLHLPSYIPGPNGNGWVKVDVGLVGMHIAHKTKSSPQWIWSTFEHVDNLAVNELETLDGKHLQPSFYDPNQQTIPVNTPLFSKDKKQQLPTQVQRVLPIAKSTQALNNHLQTLLKAENSALQYYELVGTQWPTQPTSPPTTPGQNTAPGSIANKSGGDPEPVFLTNMTLETYFQIGNQPATNLEEGNPTDTTPSFGTESCIGCHSSAGLITGFTVDSQGNKQAVSGTQLTGDFSWLLSTKAQWKNKKFTK